ncbi:MAG: Hpt domain-containing protein [Pyrinomonadaceae bacterium]|nr:Hpt domain-containing protein [Pyrinomonadaceae bacterium]
MEDFRRQFLSETAETLADLHQNLQSAKSFSGAVKRETFRVLHTVKGTAQTFGFDAASRLAHDLETLLAADANAPDLLLEGIELLQKSLTEETFQIPEQFAQKLHAVVPNAAQTAHDTDNNPINIPGEIYSQLSNQERKTIGAAMRGGKHLSVLEIGFAAANFAAELINFREILNSSGEIIATFPGAKFSDDGKIGFQFLTATSDAIKQLAEENSANVLWNYSPEKSANDINAVLRQIARHGREIAAKFGKQVAIETQIDEANFSPRELKLVFEVLLHLVRNAVDHAIERVGKIEIRVKTEANGFRLSVADDGRGIDSDKIKAKAIEKNLISAAENLTATETIDLIFQPEFSTKSETTEISGRGIGLDAVKFAVEKFGGKIIVKTEKGKGTTFEIFLPREGN